MGSLGSFCQSELFDNMVEYSGRKVNIYEVDDKVAKMSKLDFYQIS